MQFVLALIGCGVGLAILGAGLVYVFAPEPAQRFLKALATLLGIVAVGIVAFAGLANSLHPIVLLLTVMVLSPIAFYIRARRQGRAPRTEGLRGVERTPVMPRHLSKDEL